MSVLPDGPHLAETPELSGHRIGVIHVVEKVLYGPWSVEDVAESVYPQLTDQEVLDALEYAIVNREEMSQALQHRAQMKADYGERVASSAADVPASLRNH